ncbi:phage head closure protein [Thalassovita sp.]|uniref:phage head closure protein n=1 Tax=Thalassovita sp. TaxID=1979401 RepID=UPI002AAFC202|nr:phage head closure protein [Thalassovita sp.]
MTAPRLTRQLMLEDPLQVSDGAGGFTETWQALGTLWAEVAMRSGREAGGLSQARLKITLRAAPVGSSMRPRPDQRLREGARLYRIDAVHERPGSGRYLVCLAHEEVAT